MESCDATAALVSRETSSIRGWVGTDLKIGHYIVRGLPNI
jgi:hypothetical protein